MEIRVLIVEDNPITSQDLREILEDKGMIVTATARKSATALLSIQSDKPDIMLVDINLGEATDGIDLVTEVQESIDIPVIYLTANSDKATVERALHTHPSAYITKPYDEKDVVIALELAFENHRSRVAKHDKTQEVNFIFLKSGSRFEKVSLRDIQYLQADGSYTRFITKEKEYTLSGNLQNTSQKISDSCFVRIHRSFIVNINNVTGLDREYVFVGNANLPISRTYREEVKKALNKVI